MDHDPNPYDDPDQPAAAASGGSVPARGWRVPRVAVTVGLTVFLGLAGAGVAFALTGSGGSSTPSLASSSSSSSSPSSSTTLPRSHNPSARRAPGGFGGFGGPAAFGPMGGGLGTTVHGEFTVKSGSTYKTVDIQVGTVDSVSTTSLTVTSADGFKQTYVVQPSTVVDSQSGGISAISKNDSVNVEGLVQGSTVTATSVTDTTKIGSSRKGFGFGSFGHPSTGSNGTPNGAPSGTASGPGQAA